MSKRAPLSAFALRNWPRRKWYHYVSVVVGLCGIGGVIAMGGFIILRAAGEEFPTDMLVMQMFFSTIGIFIFLLAETRLKEAETPFLDQNDRDFEASKSLQAAISTVLSGAPPVTDSTVPGIRTFQRLKLVEIKSACDAQALASVEGWLNHKLGVGGFGLGVLVDNLGTGRPEDMDRTSLRLNLLATDGENPGKGGFVAFFEQDAPKGVAETAQVIVPSETATREHVSRFVTNLGRLSGSQSYRDVVLSGCAPLLQRCIVNDVGYVSARLEAILQLPPENRPTLTILGAEVTAHTVIAGAIQFGEDRYLYQLYPVGLIQRIVDVVVHTAASAHT